MDTSKYVCQTKADIFSRCHRNVITINGFLIVYVVLILQCNKKRIVDYANIWPYLRDLYQTKGFGETVNLDHIKKGYMVHIACYYIIHHTYMACI